MRETTEMLSYRELDDLLDSVERLAPSAALRRKVAEVPARLNAPQGWSFWWRPVLSVLGCAVAGVFVGWFTPETLGGSSVGSTDPYELLEGELSATELALSDQLLEDW